MVSNFGLIAFGVNILISLVIIIGFVARYRKTEGFITSVLWGIGISLVSNLIINLIGTSIFPGGFGGMDLTLASVISSALTTLGIIGAYIVASNFQFKKGVSPKSAVINAFGFSLLPLFNGILQSVNFFLYSTAINAGTADKFLTATFTAKNLEDLIAVLTTSSAIRFLDLGITRIVEFVVIIVVFNLLFKSIKSDSRIDFKKTLPAIAVIFVYHLISTLALVYLGDYAVVVIGIRLALAAGSFVYFRKALDL